MDINKPITIKNDGKKFDQADTVQNMKRRISLEALQNQDLLIYQMKKDQSDYVNHGLQNINGTIISEEPNNAIINEEISSAENLDNQDLSQGTRIHNERSDVLIQLNGRPQTRERGQKSDNVKNGLELTPDEQAERVNLFLLGLASLILMNAMAVLIILFVKLSKYEDQLVMNSNLMERQTKGMRSEDSHLFSF